MTSIIGFPAYTITTDGQVWSSKSNKYLKNLIDKQGYKKVGLRANGNINRNRFDNRIVNLRWASRKTQQKNLGMRNDNNSGHTLITYHTVRNNWVFQKSIDHKRIVCFTSKSKIECLCVKFAWIVLRKN